MYTKKGVHVEDYFIDLNFGKYRTKDPQMKINPNDIIKCFFTDEGKPFYEHLLTCDEIADEIGYQLPTNKKLRRYYRSKLQAWTGNVVNHLIENHALNFLAIKMGHNKRVVYGFSKDLHYQADNIDRRIDRIEIVEKRKRLAKSTTPKKALQILKHKRERIVA